MKARVMPVMVVHHALAIQLAFSKRLWKEEEEEKQAAGRKGWWWAEPCASQQSPNNNKQHPFVHLATGHVLIVLIFILP